MMLCRYIYIVFRAQSTQAICNSPSAEERGPRTRDLASPCHRPFQGKREQSQPTLEITVFVSDPSVQILSAPLLILSQIPLKIISQDQKEIFATVECMR